MKVCMQESKQKNGTFLGFMTARKHPVIGFVGGYLIVNELARPVEFHCTLPVQPSKAQQILYGATLTEFVCGEQIARALVSKAKCTPCVVLSDTPSVLSLRHVHPIPIASTTLGQNQVSIPYPEMACDGHLQFEVHGLKLSILDAYRSDRAIVQELIAKVSGALDLLEPFGRIEEALLEAHPASKAA
jgi:hypothetical protein